MGWAILIALSGFAVAEYASSWVWDVFAFVLWILSIYQASVASAQAWESAFQAEHANKVYQRPETIERFAVQVDANKWVYATMPGINPRRLEVLAQGLINGRPFTEREWTGKGRELTEGQFEYVRQVCLKRKLAEPKGTTPQQGYDTTPLGWVYWAQVASGEAKKVMPPSPSTGLRIREL